MYNLKPSQVPAVSSAWAVFGAALVIKWGQLWVGIWPYSLICSVIWTSYSLIKSHLLYLLSEYLEWIFSEADPEVKKCECRSYLGAYEAKVAGK